ncbi:hypothetical protein LSM04_006075 [Trypanosoma melophagium]|uniref:uncharacterized protein n=1 Tax=Trypanosoma melophagium TaxID=715481 RepID=UPI00351A2F59|nr:hypothetical protein LSM04_006075 [Trypanosoma melophagium]
MERKTLFDVSHEKISVNTAVLEMHLTSNEELRSLLYVGCANGTLHVYRIVTPLDHVAVRYDVCPSFLHCKELNSSNDDNIDNGKSVTSHGVTFLHVNSEFSTPMLLVIAGGVLDSLNYVFLNSIGLFKHLPPPQGPIITCCVDQVQGNVPRQEQQQRQPQRLALLIYRCLILVEYTERNSQIIGNVNSNTGESAIVDCPYMMVSEATKTLAWQTDLIITGSPHEYCVFNANT